MKNANDRGTKKWSAMMLTEHQEALTKLFHYDKHTEKPFLSEDQVAKIDFMLRRAVSDDLSIAITYYSEEGFHNIKGKITSINAYNKTLLMKGYMIDMEDVTEAEIL
ncbi:YolD-like family protein [Virgibacillus halophilus]|uniref:YolD-like family protein n=1 Tax=Tigheibacillus halophilus TaxID=361280 RepID=A0ABU5CA51_9BACI|nr:YolD-like family protein [Virgibacillus halophilus]